MNAALLLAWLAASAAATVAGPEALGYQRAAVEAGQWWRLVTGGFVHTNAAHWALDLGALVLLLALARRSTRSALLVTLPLLATTTMLGEHLLLRHAWAVGLSGALHGLALLLAADRRQAPVVRLVGVLAVAKVLAELVSGPAAATAALIGAPVLVSQHALGLAAGLLFAAAGAAFGLGRRPGRYAPQASA